MCISGGSGRGALSALSDAIKEEQQKKDEQMRLSRERGEQSVLEVSRLLMEVEAEFEVCRCVYVCVCVCVCVLSFRAS